MLWACEAESWIYCSSKEIHSEVIISDRYVAPAFVWLFGSDGLIIIVVEITRNTLFGSTGVINTTQATSTIRATLSPGFENYYRSQEDFWNLQKGLHDFPQMCDYIEDYRSGSVLDVLGSVGGLFALIQTAHVLLFGRPLLWGLTGKPMRGDR